MTDNDLFLLWFSTPAPHVCLLYVCKCRVGQALLVIHMPSAVRQLPFRHGYECVNERAGHKQSILVVRAPARQFPVVSTTGMS